MSDDEGGTPSTSGEGKAFPGKALAASQRGRRLLAVLREETPFPPRLLTAIHAKIMDPTSSPKAFGGYLERARAKLATILKRQEQDALSKGIRHTLWNRHVPLVPPSLRCMSWAKLLGLPVHDRKRHIDDPYHSINTYRPMGSDRQIAVDVPRCHQYHHLMSGVEGHRKLHLMCKAWLSLHPTFVYWQGVDSIAAVILSTAFNDVPLATAALGAVVNTYVPHYYNKDRTMDQQLHTYTHVLTYVDPDLALHLEHMEVKPELYTISWFLTLFAHILPTEKVYLIWDRLFKSRSLGFTVCMAVALMSQMREGICSSDFSGCVSLLSTSALQGAINVAKAAVDAEVLLQFVPQSIQCPKYNVALGSLVRTSVCALIEAAELAEAYQLRTERAYRFRSDEDEEAATEDEDSDEDNLFEPHWADTGIFLIDVRTHDEILGLVGRAETSSTRSSSVTTIATTVAAGSSGRDINDASISKTSTAIGSPTANFCNTAIIGALHLPYDGIDGWDVDAVIQLLCNRKNLWLPALHSKGTVVGGDASAHHVHPAEPLSEFEEFVKQQSEASPLKTFLSNAPHVVIVAGKDPEAGQSAAQSLLRAGTACVTMLLGGIQQLGKAAPHLIVDLD
eukprot:GILI01026088.1.p1 GENE.GILI01026088.1~~GILI01026088.1.p1  ORF type:complete len:620 (-),score=138.69 GILI01026088.1:37-1896(-)